MIFPTESPAGRVDHLRQHRLRRVLALAELRALQDATRLRRRSDQDSSASSEGYGADDLHGAVSEEHIFQSAGATSPQLRQREHATQSVPARDEVGVAIVAEMVKAILARWRDGRTPGQRNTFYEPIKILAGGHQPTNNEAEPPASFVEAP